MWQNETSLMEVVKEEVRRTDLAELGEGFWRPFMLASQILFTMSLPVDVITLTSSELHQHSTLTHITTLSHW